MSLSAPHSNAPLIWIPGQPEKSDYEKVIDNAKFESKPHGVIFLDGQEVAHTLQCPHCMMHFISQKGSGITRSFCTKCGAVTCEKRKCIENCTPFVAELFRLFGREF